MSTLTIIQKDHIRRVLFAPPALLSGVLEEAGVRFDFPCGRTGRCGQCGVEITGRISDPDASEKWAGKRLACRLRLLGDAEVILPEAPDTIPVGADGERGRNQGETESGRPVLAAADLGTTTVAVDFYDEAGRKIGSCFGDNPQQNISADVIGRTEAAMKGRGPLLRQLITGCLLDLAERSGYARRIRQWVLTGNTVMLTLLTGEDPAPLSAAPFRARRLFGESIDFEGVPAYLPPCVHAFFGADILCSLLASGIPEREGCALLCDIGTNGEMVLWKDGRGYGASVAAGPALEGAGIRRGCRGIPGAIDRVTAMGGRLMAFTLENRKAVGICGSGILDAAACGTDLGLIEHNGAMEKPMELRDGICLYPEDVRSVQLAKAALRAGMETLLEVSGTRREEIGELILCGGFGNRLNPVSAARIGLIPRDWLPVCRSMGNAALAGAGLLIREERRARAAELKERIEYISLAETSFFQSAYLRAMDMDPDL